MEASSDHEIRIDIRYRNSREHRPGLGHDPVETLPLRRQLLSMNELDLVRWDDRVDHFMCVSDRRDGKQHRRETVLGKPRRHAVRVILVRRAEREVHFLADVRIFVRQHGATQLVCKVVMDRHRLGKIEVILPLCVTHHAIEDRREVLGYFLLRVGSTQETPSKADIMHPALKPRIQVGCALDVVRLVEVAFVHGSEREVRPPQRRVVQIPHRRNPKGLAAGDRCPSAIVRIIRVEPYAAKLTNTHDPLPRDPGPRR